MTEARPPVRSGFVKNIILSNSKFLSILPIVKPVHDSVVLLGLPPLPIRLQHLPPLGTVADVLSFSVINVESTFTLSYQSYLNMGRELLGTTNMLE